MRIHYLQHIPFETPGGIETWAVKNGHELSGTPVYKGVPIAPVEMVDWLVVLGGPQNVNDEKNHPWLVAEKRYIADAIERGKAVIGVCLGAQIVANVLGARVTPNRYREIGWHAIELTDAGMSSFGTGSPRELDAFHWHGDTFDLPDGAEHLASSAACTNQMYRVGDRVLGLQCHFEMTREIAVKTR